MPEVKLTVGNRRYPVDMELVKNRFYFSFRYNPSLMAEIKAMDGAKWHGNDDPPRKVWSVKDNFRNRFQLRFLMGENPYADYDKPLVELPFVPIFNRAKQEWVNPYDHQKDLVCHWVTRRYALFAAEMGTGKSLAALLGIFFTPLDDKQDEWWFIGPTSAIRAVTLELEIWDIKIPRPVMYTYEGLKSLMARWPDGKKAPRRVVFDESSRIKTPTAQRSQAAFALAEGVREDWKEHGYVVLMSGSPAPKSPEDWWHQCEVACPGFLREGTPRKFKDRLGIVVTKESITGGTYPHLVTWRDNKDKCNTCGQFKDHPNHDPRCGTAFDVTVQYHEFVPSVNEVEHLYKRMNGLVMVKLKKDCLSLPEKVYRQIVLKPKQETLNAARLIAANSRTAIQALTLLRELSDGFQYREEVSGRKECEHCTGLGKSSEWISKDIENQVLDPTEVPTETWAEWLEDGKVAKEMITCPVCKGDGQVDNIVRTTISVPCPKEEALIDYLEDMEDCGRAVIFGGFTGSIDRIIEVCHRLDWTTIRVDGRGWVITDPKNEVIKDDALKLFQMGQMDRVAFVGHPESGGMGVTLTRCPATLYYSNDFKAENRIQSEDRIHRPGMDLNKGATIIDLIHLPSDITILNNLKKKRDLQALSMGDITNGMNYTGERQL